jgi:predicted ATP-grasp superfamily ATP-dependent carboligase
VTAAGARILVTGARLPAALAIVRALASAGAQVWAADSLRITPAGASRDARGYVRLPSPALRPDAFRAAIAATAGKLGLDAIVPVSEETFFLARDRHALPAGVALFAPPFELLRALHSKWRTLALAADCGARLPRTDLATTPAELAALVARHPGAVLKPEFSRGAYALRLPPHAALPDRHFPWLVQERIVGREISAFCIASRGDVVAASVYRPRYRVRRGAALYFEPHRCAAAGDFLARFVREHALTGHFGFDFIEDADGAVTLLECNPRATSGIHLLEGDWSSVYLGKPASAHPTARPWAATLGVVAAGLPRLFRSGGARELLRDLRRARDTTFLARDPLPAFALPLSSLEIACRSVAWGVPARCAYTYDLEWDGGGP